MQEEDQELKRRIREARGKFAAMAATYSLGVFNDNFFKQAGMLIALSLHWDEMQGRVVFVFTLPYLLFSAYAGWMADRFSKRQIVIGAKFLELAAMVVGAIGICTVNWWLIIAMSFMMGLQSAIFGPALNGSIPELYPASYVIRANAILKVVVTASILAGFALAGVALGVKKPFAHDITTGQAIVAGGVLLIAALGAILSFGVVKRPAAAPGAKFPWMGPLDTLRELFGIRKDPLLLVTIGADVFVWSTGALAVLLINKMSMHQLKLGESWTGLLIGTELIGLAAGGMISSRIAKGTQWHRVLVPAAVIMAALMGLMAEVPAMPSSVQLPAFSVLLACIGMAGGAFMIPCESFIQVRPSPQKKGTVIASSNFAVFTGIMLSGPISNALNKYVLPTNSFAIMGAVALLVGIVLFVVLPKVKDA